ncbi:MAG: hypothetical protein NC489_09010 [Ruminococcus flavefaciens]|nr:hypothetical protein [Ruminococcus flavefaciens]
MPNTNVTTESLAEDMNNLQNDLATILGTIKDPATAETIKNMMEHLTGLTDKMVSSQTTPQTILNKLKSRKFWMALIGAAAGVCGMLNSNGNITAILIFVVLEIVSILGYFFTEGTIDNTRTKELMQMATQIAAIIGTLTPTMLDASTIEVEPVVPSPIHEDIEVKHTDMEIEPEVEIPAVPEDQ